MNSPQVIRIDASAGSGKTYNLSIRYLKLLTAILDHAGGRPPHPARACQEGEERCANPDNFDAILAITFTNKAAAEMKERILLILKEIALEGKNPENFSIPRRRAEQTLFHLIRDFSDFNVMTIDAFMNTILKAFAAEAGRLPDYELTFKPQKIFSLTLDRLMAREEEAKKPFLTFLVHLLTTERTGGFDPERMIRTALENLKKSGIRPERLQTTALTFDETGQWQALRDRIAAFYTDLEEIQGRLACFNGRSVKPAQHLEKLKTRDFPGWIKDRQRSLESMVKKGKTCPDLPALERRLNEIRVELTSFFTLLEAHKLARALEMFRMTREEEARIYRELNLFDGSRLPEKLQDLFGSDPAVSAPAAFCKLGERYAHYLIDEFQDTSRSQWDGMTPLIENSLAEGGTLYYVGDTKQAIYGWRGGDYRLMEEALGIVPDCLKEPDKPKKRCKSKKLEANWRSHKVLVDFFNRLFDSTGFDAIKDESEKYGALGKLKEVYKASSQKVKGEKGGYILARFLPKPGEGEDPLHAARQTFFEALKEARRGYPDRDILVLGRKNGEIETVAGWLFEHPDPIPFVTEQSLKLFTLSPVKSLLNLLSYLALPQAGPFLHTLILDGLFGTLSPSYVETILAGYNGEVPFEEYFRERYPAWDIPLAHLRACAARLSPYELTREAAVHFGIQEKYPGSSPLLDRLFEQVLTQEHQGVTHLRDVVEAFYESAEETHLVLPEAPDALRLMTIHKAKGLEAAVVILPFLNWAMVSRNSGEIIELDGGLPVRLTSRLRDYNGEAEEKKRELDRKTFIENFNLFYVALTRAREALYLIVPFRGRGLGIGEIFRKLAVHYGFLSGDEAAFTLGNPRLERPEVREGEQTPPGERVSVSAGEIRSHLRLPPESTKETWLDERARRLGNIAHAALGTLQIVPASFAPETVARRALTRALNRMGLLLEEGTKRNLQRLLTDALQDLWDYFTAVDAAWAEKEFVSNRGEIIRVDRLIRREDTFCVIEFKTGKQEGFHVGQVRKYLRILRDLGGGVKLEGLLYYLETGEVRHV